MRLRVVSPVNLRLRSRLGVNKVARCLGAASALHQLPVQEAFEPGLQCFNRWQFKRRCQLARRQGIVLRQ